MLLHKVTDLKNIHCESKSGFWRFASPQNLNTNTHNTHTPNCCSPVLHPDSGPFMAYLLS